MFKPLVFAAASSLLIAACGEASDLDVGDPKAELGTALTDYAAHWDGYAQAYTFPGDQTDRVRVSLDEQGNGTIRFGNEELFAAATDPEAWYPPTYLSDDYERGVNVDGVRSGFEFAITGAVVEDARLKFDFDPDALMEGWCALQADTTLEGWTCGSNGYGISYPDGASLDQRVCDYHYGNPPISHEVACARVQQCHEACICDQTGCHAADRKAAATFDAVLTDNGAKLMGTLVIPSLDNARITVVMSQ